MLRYKQKEKFVVVVVVVGGITVGDDDLHLSSGLRLTQDNHGMKSCHESTGGQCISNLIPNFIENYFECFLANLKRIPEVSQRRCHRMPLKKG